jgi:hypothetical protein
MRSSAIDFLRPPRPPRLGWVLLALGVAALATALWLEQRWTSERAVAEQAEQQALAAQRALRAPPPPTEPTLAQRRWQQAQGELRRPWLPALRAIESATVNPVFLLSMTIEPGNGLIKLDGEAPSFDHALAYVQVLDEGGALQPATLLSHEQAVDPSGARGAVKFSVTTRWVNPADKP